MFEFATIAKRKYYWSQSGHVYDNFCSSTATVSKSFILLLTKRSRGSEMACLPVLGIRKSSEDRKYVGIQIPSLIVTGEPHAHVWSSEPQAECDSGWWMSPEACFHKEIIRFIPSNLSIYHQPDVINMWQERRWWWWLWGQIAHLSSDENPHTRAYTNRCTRAHSYVYMCSLPHKYTHTSNRIISVALILMPGVCEARFLPSN